MTLDQARSEVTKCKGLIQAGIDPQDIAKQQAQPQTLDDIFQHYFTTRIEGQYKHPERVRSLYLRTLKRKVGAQRPY